MGGLGNSADRVVVEEVKGASDCAGGAGGKHGIQELSRCWSTAKYTTTVLFVYLA